MQPKCLSCVPMSFNPQNTCTPSLEPTHRSYLHSPTPKVVQLVLAPVGKRKKTAHKHPHTQHQFTACSTLPMETNQHPGDVHSWPQLYYRIGRKSYTLCGGMCTGKTYTPALSHQRGETGAPYVWFISLQGSYLEEVRESRGLA